MAQDQKPDSRLVGPLSPFSGQIVKDSTPISGAASQFKATELNQARKLPPAAQAQTQAVQPGAKEPFGGFQSFLQRAFKPNPNNMLEAQNTGPNPLNEQRDKLFKLLGVDHGPDIPTTNESGETVPTIISRARGLQREARDAYVKEMQNQPPSLRHVHGSLGLLVGSIAATALANKWHQSSQGMAWLKGNKEQQQQHLDDTYKDAMIKFNQSRESALAQSSFKEQDAQQALKDVQTLRGQGAAATENWLKRLQAASILQGKEDTDQSREQIASNSRYGRDWNGWLNTFKTGASTDIRNFALMGLKHQFLTDPTLAGKLNLPMPDELRDYLMKGIKPKGLDPEYDKAHPNNTFDPSAATPREQQTAANTKFIQGPKTTQANANTAKANATTANLGARTSLAGAQKGLVEAKTKYTLRQWEELPKKLALETRRTKAMELRADKMARGGNKGSAESIKQDNLTLRALDGESTRNNALIIEADKTIKQGSKNGANDEDIKQKQAALDVKEEITQRQTEIRTARKKITDRIAGIKKAPPAKNSMEQEDQRRKDYENKHKSAFNPFDNGKLNA